MEVLTVIAAALAFAGGEAKTVVGEGVKDAYRAMKDFLFRRYPQVDLAPVEKAPDSTGQQPVLVENLTNSEAAADPDFSPLAKRLVDAVAAEIRRAGPRTGVQLREFEAASLRINDVIASGAGVIAEKTKIAGHAEITGIRAGVTEDRDSKKTVTAAEPGAAAVILDHVWVGAGIHVHTGGPAGAREPFLPWRDLPDDPEAVFALLSWRARLAPLVGRDQDKDTLLQWARRGRDARIRLLTGPGGVGKSRLAAEVAEALRAEGWTAGFIRPNDPIVIPLRRAGLFLIVDYPEEHPDEVRTLMREVASREMRDVPLRLLVLSRQGGDRWFDLVESAHAGELMDAQEIGLRGLAAAEPERVFSESLRRLAEHYRRPVPAVSVDAVRSWVALNPGLHGLPLLLTAAAVHAFLNPDAALGFSGGSVVNALADRERARHGSAGRAAGLGDRGAGRVVALAAVPGSLDASALRRLADPTIDVGLPSEFVDAGGKKLVRYFVSYSRRDKPLKDDLLNRLEDRFGAARSFEFAGWQDKDIEIGSDWNKQIEAAIADCDFGLLLVSPAFLANNYIRVNELPNFVSDEVFRPTTLKRAVPVALKPVLFDGSMDLKGLEQKQIFHDADRRAYQQLNGNSRKDNFANQLFGKIIEMLDKLPSRSR